MVASLARSAGAVDSPVTYRSHQGRDGIRWRIVKSRSGQAGHRISVYLLIFAHVYCVTTNKSIFANNNDEYLSKKKKLS